MRLRSNNDGTHDLLLGPIPFYLAVIEGGSVAREARRRRRGRILLNLGWLGLALAFVALLDYATGGPLVRFLP